LRTQDEILKMIRLLRESGTDPTNVQQKTLFHKLEWKTAVEWVHPSKRTQEYRQKFETMNKTDAASLTEELIDRVDQLFMFLADGDVMKVHVHLQMIMVYLWLLRKDDLFSYLHGRLSWHNMNWRAVGRHLADELGINWRTLELRYI
jgi:DNA-directed RNA polymerase subunit F